MQEYFYNKTIKSVICAIIASICLLFVIVSARINSFIGMDILLIISFIGAYFFTRALVNYAFYVDNISIKILFKTIYWQDINRIEISKKADNIYIYHSGKRTEVNFVEYFFLEIILFGITEMICFIPFFGFKTGLILVILLSIAGMMGYIKYYYCKLDISPLLDSLIAPQDLEYISLIKEKRYKEAGNLLVDRCKSKMKPNIRIWIPEYVEGIITSIIFCSEFYYFTKKEEIISGERKIVLTRPNTDNKE